MPQKKNPDAGAGTRQTAGAHFTGLLTTDDSQPLGDAQSGRYGRKLLSMPPTTQQARAPSRHGPGDPALGARSCARHAGFLHRHDLAGSPGAVSRSRDRLMRSFSHFAVKHMQTVRDTVEMSGLDESVPLSYEQTTPTSTRPRSARSTLATMVEGNAPPVQAAARGRQKTAASEVAPSAPRQISPSTRLDRTADRNACRLLQPPESPR